MLPPPRLVRPVALAATAALLLTALVGADPASTASARAATRDPAPTVAVAGPRAPRPTGLVTTTARRSASAYDTTSRTAVRRAYHRDLLPLLWAEPPVVPDACAVAATPLATQRRTIAAVNVARRLAGLDPVRLDTALSRQAQRAALIQHFLGFLTHTPAPGSPCWSQAGAQAAGLSNLALGYEGARAVLAYLADPGPGNRAVGHRRWLLAPTTEAMGTGQVGLAHAMLVVPPPRLRSDRNATPTWIRWPTAGWFPAELEPGRRWSFGSARPGLDLRRATVRVSTGGRQVALRRHRPHPGYGGQAALVWDLLEPIAVPREGARAVTVTVRGMTVRGRRLPAVRYTVRLFRAG